MKIHSLTEQYITDLVEIAKISMPYPWSEKIRDCLKDHYFEWVLGYDNQVVGFIVILLQHAECQLMNIAVKPQHKRRKFAECECLLIQAIDFTRTRFSYSYFISSASYSNEVAIDFYKKNEGH
ncbi:GNAT family N-acetyltransferase [Candidatus Coxiella mudrowiae]|uniref:GNAT family N-acetyltransferase n=1 Tax=Candidatus Coxiella mudrowiae TaxID=2054173 RepID=UPI000C281DAA|nr:GNAT family N-acetyltransferase [Candidatus Coxiella mudrowiae]